MINGGQTDLFRYEKKYLISQIQEETFRMKIASVCDMDPYAGNAGRYRIRSLYFDDYTDSSYQANEMGTEPRSKWRIRTYDHNTRMIRLEQKIKMGGKIHKDSAQISEALCFDLLHDANHVDYPTDNKVLNRFLTDCFTKNLCPKIIVEYDREPYVYDAGDVRITFDSEVSFSDQVDRFFEKDIFLYPVFGLGKLLLEVKYTEFLPGILHSLLDGGDLQQTTFSKYYLARKWGCLSYDII